MSSELLVRSTLQPTNDNRFYIRIQEDILEKASTCSGLQPSPEPGLKRGETLLTELFATLEENDSNSLRAQEKSNVVPDTDLLGLGEDASQQATFSGSLGLGGVADFSFSSCSQREDGMPFLHSCCQVENCNLSFP